MKQHADRLQYQFTCPESMRLHFESVLMGEYDCGLATTNPVILDIGANCGAFALWAAGRYPGAILHCYEPVPENFGYLVTNTSKLSTAVQCYNVAVTSRPYERMYLGRNNCGEASFFRGPQQSDDTILVRSIRAAELPPCDILKIDTEGCEVEILFGFLDAGRCPKAVFLEYHSERDRRTLDSLLGEHYVLARAIANKVGQGVLCYVERTLFEKSPD